MHRSLRSLITFVVVLSILLAVPIPAGARGRENPQSAVGVAESFLDAAVNWFQDVLTFLGRHHSSEPPAGIVDKDDSPGDNGLLVGSCIDPNGDRYPPPCIRN